MLFLRNQHHKNDLQQHNSNRTRQLETTAHTFPVETTLIDNAS
jgi:hypothetical protein